MATRSDDQLQTLESLLRFNAKISKACTLGVIVDATSEYYDDSKKLYMKKIKVIDQSLNPSNAVAKERLGHCTVMFFAKDSISLPNPEAIGDIIYLRRFAFQRYNDCFQGHSNSGQYCSWVVMKGDDNFSGFSPYQFSRIGYDLDDEKYEHLLAPIQGLRKFSRFYLERHSVLASLPPTVVPKDKDMIVQLIKNYDTELRLRSGKQQLTLKGCLTFMQEGDIGKLRSVARLETGQKGLQVVRNNFTSLTKLPVWSFDVQNAIRSSTVSNIENDSGIITELNYIMTAPLKQCEGRIYNCRCQVFSIAPNTFTEAVKYYDEKKNVLHETPKKDTIPAYKVLMAMKDASLKGARLAEVWIWSWDKKGSDFVTNVDLSELNEFSSLKQETDLYSSTCDRLLEAEGVRVAIQVLSDGKGNRMLRAVGVNF